MRGRAEQKITLTVEFDSKGEWEMVRDALADIPSPSNKRQSPLSLLALAMDEAASDAERILYPDLGIGQAT